MSAPRKDAFYQPPKAEEGVLPERITKDPIRRLIVDGVEVDPETMQPLDSQEE